MMDDLFIRLGLSQKESTAFLELVRLGACPVSTWAKHANINRTSMYVMMERFKSLGLVNTFVHKGIMYVQAIRMAEISALLYDKERVMETTRGLLEKYLADLQKLEKAHGITPKVRFYEGKNRVEAMYEEVVDERSFKAFFNPERVKRVMPVYFHKIPQMLKAHGGRAKELLIRCKEAEEYLSLYKSEKHEILMLPRDVKFSSDTIITEQKIFLVGYSEDDVVATEIWNEELAQTQSVLFDLVWEKTR